MDNHYIPRTLWYKKRDANNQEETIEISEDQLLLETRPLIVLGEAGMGKTELMKRLGNRNGYTHCTAKKLLLRDPKSIHKNGSTLVIDALDEATSKYDGDAISEVLEKLELLGFPRFVLSCRVAEWQSRTAISTIKTGDYTQEPLEVHLKPFSEADIRSFLTTRLGADRAVEVHTHFEQLGFIDWLGNPQTLDLICAVASKGSLPHTRSELFKLATEKLAEEHNDEKAITQKPVAKLLSAAGAACAALILCGKQSIVRKPQAWLEEDELLLQDVEQLPHGSEIDSALNTKLFIAHGADQFGYMHRRIGEYLAAKWLAQQADTDRKRRRLLAMFQHLGMVPASLRGLYAWLAHDMHLAQPVIAFDPLAVLEYGETDALSAAQARLLLQALERITEANPHQWQLRSLKARCFAQAELKAEVLHWMTNKDPDMVWLRVLVIESIEGSGIAKALAQPLTAIITDTHDVFATRSAAFHSLACYLTAADSRALVDQLAAMADESSLRLALEISQHQGFENFEATVLANICIAFVATKSRMGGMFFYVQNGLPSSLLPNFLDTLTAGIAQIEEKHDFEVTYDIKSLAFALIARAIDTQQAKAAQVLQWLSAIEDLHFSGGEEIKKLNAAFLGAPELRQEILRTVLVTQSTNDTLRQQYVKLLHYPSALHPTESDLIDLLEAMPTNDERWQGLVLLTQHDQEKGAAIRQIAQKFVYGNPAGQEWLEKLTAPRPKHEWEIKQEAYAAKRKAQQAAERKQRIAWHAEHLEALKGGRWEACHKAAAIYVFGQYGESHKDILPIQRLQEALSEELAQAALIGFEACLLQLLTSTTLDEIAAGYVTGKVSPASYVVLAGLLERLRNSQGVEDLSDERILSAFFFLQAGHFHHHLGAKAEALNACIREALVQRNLLEQGLRLFYEPQLKANVEHISNLHGLLHEEAFAGISTDLAQEWLQRFPELRPETETQFLDHLIRVEAMGALYTLAQQRPNPHPNPDQHRTWEVIRFLTDFEATSQRLKTQAIDAKLIWELRDRSQHGHYARYEKPLIWSTAQYAWVFEKFRALWPAAARPFGTSSGSHNSWQATEYLHSIAEQLANTTTTEAITALQGLRDAPQDSYTELLQSLCTQQLRKLCEQNYEPAPLDALQSIAHDAAPKSIADLQAWVIEELQVVQNKIRSNDVNSWRGFYDDTGTPYEENRCRDQLLELLRQGAQDVHYEPETHVANDKEVDITCSVGSLRLPIEIKGQWHDQVWTAADKQLARQYTPDWRAKEHGIYVVLWFGEQQDPKKLKSLGRRQPIPASADEMQAMLTARSKAAQSGKVKVVVLNIQPSATAQPALSKAEPQAQAIQN